MRWSDSELVELQDNHLIREIKQFTEEYYQEWDLVFDLVYDNKYEELWPGITDPSKTKEQLKSELEPLFYECFNTIITRCFGWGLPMTSFVPFADCINHHNVDSTYEFICKELHEPIKHFSKNQEEAYNININDFI